MEREFWAITIYIFLFSSPLLFYPVNEIFFLVEEASEGGYAAKALGESIFTEADTLEELHANVRDAVRCHFDEGKDAEDDPPAVTSGSLQLAPHYRTRPQSPENRDLGSNSFRYRIPSQTYARRAVEAPFILKCL